MLVNFYGDKLIRKNFDSLYRLVKAERFKTGAAAKNITLETQIDYTYAEDSNRLKTSVEDMISLKKKVENEFDSNGRVTCKLESHYEEREVKSSKKKAEGDKPETEEVLLSDKKTERLYDESGRTVEEEVTTWSYKTNSFGRYITEERKIKNVYDYSAVSEENNVPPNMQFYEDGQLHLERKYTDSEHYSEKLYFDDGFSIELLYEDGLKKTEIIYVNDVEQRRREFEY